MKWSEISIHTTNEAIEAVSNLLHEAGASGVAIDDPEELTKDRTTALGEMYELDPEDYPEEGVIVKAYIQEDSNLSKILQEIEQGINRLSQFNINTGKSEIIVNEVQEEDWATAWKKYYKPIKISEKITIIPTWEPYTPKNEGEIIIELDPGMAFGTGTHPTTILSLQAIERYMSPGDTVLDIGSGSGVLSIGAALLGAAFVHAYDLDNIAVKSTQTNAELNNVENLIAAKENNLMNGVDVKAEIIVSNILAEIIVQFTEQAYKQLKPGGLFITSGIIKQKMNMVEEELKNSGFEIIEKNQMEDWLSYVCRKPE